MPSNLIVPPDIEAFAIKLHEAADLDAVFKVIVAYCEHLGFERFAYMWMKAPDTLNGKRLGQLCITNFLETWSSHYERQRMVADDYVFHYSARNILPFAWNFITSTFRLTKRQRLVFTDAADAGMKEGVSVPVHGAFNSRAVFSVTGDMKKAEFEKLYAAKKHHLHLAAQYIHSRIMQFDFGANLPDGVALTPREVEVLTQMAMGKSREIAAINLGVSSETVKAHLDNVREKLGAANTTNAVAIALIHGMIHVPQKGNII